MPFIVPFLRLSSQARFLKKAWQKLLICEIGIQRTRFHGSPDLYKHEFAVFRYRGGVTFSACPEK